MRFLPVLACAAHPCETGQACAYLKVLAVSATLLLAACTGAPETIARAAPCDIPGVVAYGADGTLLECNGAIDESIKRAGIRGIWSVPGVDMPIEALATPGTKCTDVGALAHGPDDSVLRCMWNKADMPLYHGPQMTHAE